MKTKIKILIVSCVMAAATVTGFNLAQNSNNMDVTLADIAAMANAYSEFGPRCYDPVYMITYIGSGCDYTIIETLDCHEGNQLSMCTQGFEGTDYFCDEPPSFWSKLTSLHC